MLCHLLAFSAVLHHHIRHIIFSLIVLTFIEFILSNEIISVFKVWQGFMVAVPVQGGVQ